MHIGQVIHRARTANKMALVELADKSGVALATLSRMENGKMTGTLGSHMKICDALGISLPDLYKDLVASKKRVDLGQKKSRAELFSRDRSTATEVLVSKIQNKKMAPLLLRLNKSSSTHREDARPGCERFVYCLDGKVEANIGDEKYILTKGDTLYFELSLPHYFRNLGNSECRLLAISSPPNL